VWELSDCARVHANYKLRFSLSARAITASSDLNLDSCDSVYSTEKRQIPDQILARNDLNKV
jgi:hypothetical protein